MLPTQPHLIGSHALRENTPFLLWAHRATMSRMKHNQEWWHFFQHACLMLCTCTAYQYSMYIQHMSIQCKCTSFCTTVNEIVTPNFLFVLYGSKNVLGTVWFISALSTCIILLRYNCPVHFVLPAVIFNDNSGLDPDSKAGSLFCCISQRTVLAPMHTIGEWCIATCEWAVLFAADWRFLNIGLFLCVLCERQNIFITMYTALD